jgi:predicted phosphodiesterase
MALQRIAIVSDIHGNLPALEAVIAEIGAAGADAVVNLGDIVSGPLWPAETAARLMALGWLTIAGNHERQLLTQLLDRQGLTDAQTTPRLLPAQSAWLASLLPTCWLADDLFCCHGSPSNDLQYLLETVTPDLGQHGSPGIRAATADELRQRLGDPGPATLLLCGHSHVPRAVQHGATLLLNPGSVGLPAFDDDHPYPHRVQLGSPHARWALAERDPQRPAAWRVQLRATPYDQEAAARQAESMGRGDWADALRSGWVGRLEQEISAR